MKTTLILSISYFLLLFSIPGISQGALNNKKSKMVKFENLDTVLQEIIDDFLMPADYNVDCVIIEYIMDSVDKFNVRVVNQNMGEELPKMILFKLNHKGVKIYFFSGLESYFNPHNPFMDVKEGEKTFIEKRKKDTFPSFIFDPYNFLYYVKDSKIIKKEDLVERVDCPKWEFEEE